MKHLLLTAALIAATPLYAGGPVIVADETEVIAEAPRSNNWILPILGIALIACIIACGGDNDAAPPGPERWKVRSKTFQGMAEAWADQWGGWARRVAA